MAESSDSSEYATYLNLCAEYQQSVTRCVAALEHLGRIQRELQEAAGEMRFDPHRFSEPSRLHADLRRIVGCLDGVQVKKIDGLSRREREVFEGIGRGLTSSEVAMHLHVAPSTVETYRERLKHKLELSSGAALTRCAILWTATHEPVASDGHSAKDGR